MIGDIFIFGNPQTGQPGSIKKQVQAAATTITAGQPVKINASARQYVVPLADAEPVVGTTAAMYGIAATTSTQTASLDGVVDVFEMVPGLRYIAKAKSFAAVDTQAEYDALVGKRVLLDLTSGVYTVDTGTTDDAANGIIIEDYDVKSGPGSVVFTIKVGATILA